MHENPPLPPFGGKRGRRSEAHLSRFSRDSNEVAAQSRETRDRGTFYETIKIGRQIPGMNLVKKLGNVKSFSVRRGISRLAGLFPKFENRRSRQWEDAVSDRDDPFESLNRPLADHNEDASENFDKLKEYQEFVKKEPWNPHAHLTLAKAYDEKGEKQKATAEYFLVAEIFCKNGLYPHAISIYKQIEKTDPSLEVVRLKIADVYQKMGLLDDAFSQYSQLLRHYHTLGRQDKRKEILDLMAYFDQKGFHPDEKAYIKYRLLKECSEPQEEKSRSEGFSGEDPDRVFDLNAELEISNPIAVEDEKEIAVEKIYGYADILKELKKSGPPDQIHPNYFYHLGLACLEMGFIHEATDQFQIAIERGQNPFESARLLSTCITQKGPQDPHCESPESPQENLMN